MSIYKDFVYDNRLISPINGYECKRITKQNIKNFGFNTVEELLTKYPGFSLMCKEYNENKVNGLLKSEKLKENYKNKTNKSKQEKETLEKEYYSHPNTCPKCGNEKTYKKRNNLFCSRKCSNSRGPRSNSCKEKISISLKGRKLSKETVNKILISKNQKPYSEKPNTICVICKKDTNTKNRKTCSDVCYRLNSKIKSQKNPKCGGKKQSFRSKIVNGEGKTFISESSYEVILSNLLNSLSIKWERPSYFWYYDEHGNKRRYYPDFYLPEYNLYLDPKNSYLIKTDIDKIYRASIHNNIAIVILGIDSLNEISIKNMVGNKGNAPFFHGCKPRVLLLN